MFSGQLRNGASRQEFDTDSRLARGNANRAQVQTNEPSFRIQSREVARRRDSETADFAGNSNSTTAALDGASQRNVVADALQPRSVWHTMQDGNSQSQSLVSGSNSQSAVNTSNNAPPGLPNLLTTVGSSLPTKNAVPTILQKPATIKSTTGTLSIPLYFLILLLIAFVFCFCSKFWKRKSRCCERAIRRVDGAETDS